MWSVCKRDSVWPRRGCGIANFFFHKNLNGETMIYLCCLPFLALHQTGFATCCVATSLRKLLPYDFALACAVPDTLGTKQIFFYINKQVALFRKKSCAWLSPNYHGFAIGGMFSVALFSYFAVSCVSLPILAYGELRARHLLPCYHGVSRLSSLSYTEAYSSVIVQPTYFEERFMFKKLSTKSEVICRGGLLVSILRIHCRGTLVVLF